jgi:predicted N-formylglutamate amidohydrolase
VLNGKVRNYDAGILYDPSRGEEAELAGNLIKHMNSHGIKTVANRPYKGTADGHTTALRKEFPADRYIGIEIELSQKFSVKEMIGISTEIASFF